MQSTENVYPTKIADLPDICTGKHLEAVFGIPEGTWRYWAHSSQGPASFRLGKHRFYRRDAVLAWLAEAEAASDSA